jgi:hypothetical protein
MRRVPVRQKVRRRLSKFYPAVKAIIQLTNSNIHTSPERLSFFIATSYHSRYLQTPHHALSAVLGQAAEDHGCVLRIMREGERERASRCGCRDALGLGS